MPISDPILDPWKRAAFLNDLVGRPYAAGADGPEAFDCYGLTRHLQLSCFGRKMPPFLLPRGAGRIAIASAIATHPERENWVPVREPVDGAIALMARRDIAWHMGTYFDLDGGLVVHALEDAGVSAAPPWRLWSQGGGRWRFEWHIRVDEAIAGDVRAA
jgi:hypothetical protein